MKQLFSLLKIFADSLVLTKEAIPIVEYPLEITHTRKEGAAKA